MSEINAPSQSKKLTWRALGLIGFSSVWGFHNAVNGFVYFNGIQAIFSWLVLFVLYFIPYLLMIAEMGSTFKNSSGGVPSWLGHTAGRTASYMQSWTYWAVHIVYLASKGSYGLKSLSWAVFRNATTFDQIHPLWIQIATLAVFLFFCFVSSRGLTTLRGVTTVSGIMVFVMSLLFVLLMLAAPVLKPESSLRPLNFHLKDFLPNFNLGYFASLSILVLALGGAEDTSPYVSNLKRPSRDYPKSMIFVAVMVILCAILSTAALSMIFDPALIHESEESFDSYLANGAYWAFQRLGQHYGIGDTLLIVYSLCNAVAQFTSLLICVDAPLRMLLDNESSKEFIPSVMFRQNRHGAYVNGIRLLALLSGSIILAQILVPGATTVIAQLTKLNAICMPLCFLGSFLSYIQLRRKKDQFPSEYCFVKNNRVALFFGYWCLGITLISCIIGIYSTDPHTLALNIITPCVLLGLGCIMPLLKHREHCRR